MIEENEKIMEALGKRFLDIEKVNKLDLERSEYVMALYNKMINLSTNKIPTNNVNVYYSIISIMNTLIESGYLLTKRESNLNKLLED